MTSSGVDPTTLTVNPLGRLLDECEDRLGYQRMIAMRFFLFERKI